MNKYTKYIGIVAVVAAMISISNKQFFQVQTEELQVTSKVESKQIGSTFEADLSIASQHTRVEPKIDLNTFNTNNGYVQYTNAISDDQLDGYSINNTPVIQINRGRSLVTSVEPYATPAPSATTPDQIKYAYGLDKIKYTGKGQTIAIIIPYGSPNLVNDFKVFSKTFGYPETNLQIAYPLGMPTATNDSWALEATLDCQWAHAIAPEANILVVVAKTSSISDLTKCVEYAVSANVKVVSMSWGSVEWSSQSGYDPTFNKPGVAMVAATGDFGFGTSWPSVNPYVLAVGGTTLTFNSNNTISEDGWSKSSGGVSKYYLRPSFQNGFTSSVSRNTPDVSFNATRYSVYMKNYKGVDGWISVSGTSGSAPCYAGVIALANSARTTSLALVNQSIYSLANSTTYSICFKDITTGNNGVAATAKYDNVTGLGTPNAPALISGLMGIK